MYVVPNVRQSKATKKYTGGSGLRLPLGKACSKEQKPVHQAQLSYDEQYLHMHWLLLQCTARLLFSLLQANWAATTTAVLLILMKSVKRDKTWTDAASDISFRAITTQSHTLCRRQSCRRHSCGFLVFLMHNCSLTVPSNTSWYGPHGVVGPCFAVLCCFNECHV